MKCDKHDVELVKSAVGYVCPECVKELEAKPAEGELKPVAVYDCPKHGKDVVVLTFHQGSTVIVGPVCAACLDEQLKVALPKLVVREEVRRVKPDGTAEPIQSAEVDETVDRR